MNSRSLWFTMIVSGTVLLSWQENSRAEDDLTLSKKDGPFMVGASLFSGPKAEVQARALALELRKEFGLPAFVYRGPRTKPGQLPMFAVLVGNAKTLQECTELLQRVRKIKPKSLPETALSETGLTKALRTVNPLVDIGCTFPPRRANPDPAMPPPLK
jgi:hypothetical protein